MGMGQAAGTAAALAARGGYGSREVPIVDLQDRLVQAGCILDPTISTQSHTGKVL
jgi:hypothetical protein